MKKKHSKTDNMHTTSPTQGKISGHNVRGMSKATSDSPGGSVMAGCASNSAYGARRIRKQA